MRYVQGAVRSVTSDLLSISGLLCRTHGSLNNGCDPVSVDKNMLKMYRGDNLMDYSEYYVLLYTATTAVNCAIC